jgi:hypothetical protein
MPSVKYSKPFEKPPMQLPRVLGKLLEGTTDRSGVVYIGGSRILQSQGFY